MLLKTHRKTNSYDKGDCAYNSAILEGEDDFAAAMLLAEKLGQEIVNSPTGDDDSPRIFTYGSPTLLPEEELTGIPIPGRSARDTPPRFGFFSSMSTSPLSSSPPYKNSPPHKKVRKNQQDEYFMQEAGIVYEKIKQLHSMHPIINQLLDAYDFIRNTGDIGIQETFLLMNPIAYAIKERNPITETLPQETTHFCKRFACKMFLQAQETLRNQLEGLISEVIAHSKNSAEQHASTLFIQALLDLILKSDASAAEYKEIIDNFDLDKLGDEFVELKKYLSCSKTIFNNLTPETCAQTILDLIKKQDIQPYKELFTVIADEGLNHLDRTQIQTLLDFECDNLVNYYTVAKNIDAFIKIFHNNLQELSQGLTLSPP